MIAILSRIHIVATPGDAQPGRPCCPCCRVEVPADAFTRGFVCRWCDRYMGRCDDPTSRFYDPTAARWVHEHMGYEWRWE